MTNLSDQQACSVLASSIFHLLNFSVKFPYFYAFSVLIVFVSSYVLLLLTSVSSCACCNIIQSQWRHHVSCFLLEGFSCFFVENCWQERNSCNKNEWSRQCACAMTNCLKANHSLQIHPVATLDPKNLIMNPKTTRMTNCKPTNTWFCCSLKELGFPTAAVWSYSVS